MISEWILLWRCQYLFYLIANMIWKDLAPALIRQRIIIEWISKEIIKPNEISEFLDLFAEHVWMEKVSGPFVYSAHEMWYGGRIHRKSSWWVFYSYPTNPPLFTLDAYTCKPFNPAQAALFTKKHFNAIELVRKEI